MRDQPRFEPYEATDFFDDGKAARMPPFGTVARGRVDALDQAFSPDIPTPPPEAFPESSEALVPLELLQRGQERFTIWCAPCHGLAGYGDGPVAQRGYPSPPSYHTERLRKAPDSHLLNVIRHGLGKMPPYGRHVPEADQRAIVAYIRALQLSQHATMADVPETERAVLKGEP